MHGLISALALLGLTFGFRSYYWEHPADTLLPLPFMTLSLLPVAIATTFEQLTRIRTPRVFKALILFSGTGFSIAALVARSFEGWKLETALFENRFWMTALLIYYIGTAVYLLALFLKLRSSFEPSKNEGRILREIIYFGSFALIYQTMTWIQMPAIGSEIVSAVSAFLFLIFSYNVGNIHSRHEFRSSSDEARTLLVFLICSLLGGGILFLGGVTVISASQYYSAAGLIFACTLMFSTIYSQTLLAHRRTPAPINRQRLSPYDLSVNSKRLQIPYTFQSPAIEPPEPLAQAPHLIELQSQYIVGPGRPL